MNKENSNKEKYTYDDLLGIMARLRKECPWDREQTHDSLRIYLLEEAYEVLDAMDKKNSDRFCDELGDLLLQVVFHAEIARENGSFDMGDVVDGICRKLILRHTHIFGDVKCGTAGEVLSNWEEIKKKEKGLKSHTGVLNDVPASLPALMRSYKVQQKAAQVGFDWDDIKDVFSKVEEELEELKEAWNRKNTENMADELGDLLFSVVNLSRFMGVQPELCLNKTIQKFISRFEYIEKESEENGRKLQDMTLQEMDELWNEAKRKGDGNKD
jgi:tetrapyrrole methylase family protein/MazG family protein